MCLSRFSTILFTRFILNLRSMDKERSVFDRSLHVSSVQFATSLAGNIGAPLERPGNASSEWSSSLTEVQIDNPLSIGILYPPVRYLYVSFSRA